MLGLAGRSRGRERLAAPSVLPLVVAAVRSVLEGVAGIDRLGAIMARVIDAIALLAADLDAFPSLLQLVPLLAASASADAVAGSTRGPSGLAVRALTAFAATETGLAALMGGPSPGEPLGAVASHLHALLAAGDATDAGHWVAVAGLSSSLPGFRALVASGVTTVIQVRAYRVFFFFFFFFF